MRKPDGGPAFPRFELDSGAGGSVGGMSLRDWFAGQALNGFMASLADHLHRETLHRKNKDQADFAAACYIIADAMLVERAKA